jgi:hypothetical protein
MTVCDGAVNDIVTVVFVRAETLKLVGVFGTNNVLDETVTEPDVPSAFVADKDIVYVVFSTKPVIW